MNRIGVVWQLLRYQGLSWVAFRALQRLLYGSGWEARRRPVSEWDGVPLAQWLVHGKLAEHQRYHEFRRRSDARFFFDGYEPADGTPLFELWDRASADAVLAAERVKRGECVYFGNTWLQLGRPPNWHQNPFTGEEAPSIGHWSRLDEFGSGDIKLVWELNRFGFVFPLVRAYWRTGDDLLAECFWQLVEDWRRHNPPRTGINWRCGQEAAFRAMALCFGLYGLARARATTSQRVVSLAQTLAVTGRRIGDNFAYALSQRNNHGITEATALFTIGTLFPEFALAGRWRDKGRDALEKQARELIYEDGGFSQHSVNYHRVMVEDYLWCIQLGRANGVEFTPELVRRVGQAGQWLKSLQDPQTGRLPNWGANDGGHVLPLSNCGYLDYRPVVQATAMVTAGRPSLHAGPWDEQAWWLGCPMAANPAKSQSLVASGDTLQTGAEVPVADRRQDFPNSGLIVLRAGAARVVLRTVRRFRHRPAQCDLLHLDFWSGPNNILRDSGSYSYNSPDGLGGYFKSAAAHNTIQFDGHDQMPVLGRFLYGQWPLGDVSLRASDPLEVTASYEDWLGCRHQRKVTLGLDRCLVSDRLSGFRQEAVLRWHLCSDVDWKLIDSTCTSPLAVIRVTADGINNSRLTEGWESLFYNAKSPLSVFEISVGASVREIETEILFA